MPELIRERLRRLRRERDDMSRSALSRKTVKVGFEGISEATIESLETRPGVVPEAWIVEALAEALGVPPESFYEYAIARARPETPTRRALREAVEAAEAEMFRRGRRSPDGDDV